MSSEVVIGLYNPNVSACDPHSTCYDTCLSQVLLVPSTILRWHQLTLQDREMKPQAIWYYLDTSRRSSET